jgi:hypothetical protein
MGSTVEAQFSVGNILVGAERAVQDLFHVDRATGIGRLVASR